MTKASPSPQTVIYVDHSPLLGGSSRLLLNFIVRLPSLGVTPVVLCRRDSPLRTKCEENGIRHFTAYMPLLTIQTGFFSWFTYVWAIFSTTLSLVLLAKKVKASYIHANGFLAAVYCTGSAKLSRTPCIWHMHDILERRTLNKIVVRFVAWGALRIICVSHAVKTRLVELGVDPAKCRVIHNFVSPPADEPVVKALRADLRIPADASIVGMVGNICAMKGQQVFVEAIKEIADRHPDTLYIIIGDILTEIDLPYKESLLRMIRESGLESKVLLTGFRSDAFWLIQEMDILVHPVTLPEAFGLVLAEAMYHERPVIASRIGGIPEVVIDGVNGLLVPPQNAHALAQAMSTLLDRTDLRTRMGVEGKRTVAAAFQLDSFLISLISVYNEKIT